jgi:hypothetical protein
MRFHRFCFASLFPVVAVACGGKTEGAGDPDSAALGDAPYDGSYVVPDSVSDTPVDPDAPPPPPPSPSDKVDLLLVVDNSSSMSDKQGELAKRIPELVSALTNPPAGSGRTAIGDLHVGVITSSLGSHGTSACDPTTTNIHNNDHGHLLPRGDATCAGAVTASALSWTFDPAGTASFEGVAGVDGVQAATACVVASAKDDGCGYEETLESMYHFLIDPAPYLTAEVKCTFGATGDACGSNKIEVRGTDSELLAERKAFLRPDSVVQIVVLSDENDFSLKPAQLNWLPWGYGAGQMQRGWKACETVPDDFEPETGAEYAALHSTYKCFSCFENTADPNCSVPWPKVKLNSDTDGRALRGFHQINRYGYSFLWGRQRYVDGLTKSTVPGIDSSGALVGMPNPLFAGGRPPGNVFLAVIVGVPPLLVGDASGAPRPLSGADWERIASADLAKRDPHMIESIAPRTAYGVTKFAGDRTVDSVNGGDRDIPDGDDLQYACIGPRATTTATPECSGPSPAVTNPMCGPGGTQPYYKAYPGLRHLRIAHDFGANALVGSICNASFSPVMTAIADKIQPALKGR